MVFLLSLDFDSTIQPAITCALFLMPFRATDFLVMRGIVEVVWLIVERGGSLAPDVALAAWQTFGRYRIYFIAETIVISYLPLRLGLRNIWETD